MDPDQARRIVGPDLGPNCLQRIPADNNGRQRVNFLLANLKHILITVKFGNFGMPEIFAVMYLKFKQRGQTLKDILSKWCKRNSKQ